jgi:hypothetical protein
MNRLRMGLIAAGMTLAVAATPALAQQDGQEGGMMGQGGAGQDKGMMKGGMMQGGMMGQSKSSCPKMSGMMGHGMMGRGMMHSRPMMEARLAYIKADLEITDAQTDAWDAYADAFRKRHDSMTSMRADMMQAKIDGTAEQRLDARIKAAEAKLEGLKALKAPTEALYQVLSDEQKKKADALLGGGCGMM